MDFELWWLLAIPAFFALGWFAARADLREQIENARRLPDAYFRGLNFLLNEESERAIGAFVDVIRLDPEAAELHFALGNLFRRRGETDRAIRVHEHLAGRMDLAAAVRDQARFELGQDYLKAGLLDRAEASFCALERSAMATRAGLCRLEIAQTERDWQRAIALGQTLLQGQPESGAKVQALDEGQVKQVRQFILHFHCEAVEHHLRSASTGAAQSGSELDRVALATALAALEEYARWAGESGHPRVLQLRAQCALAINDCVSAMQAWRELGESQPLYLAPVAEQVLATWHAQGQLAHGLVWLQECYARAPSHDLLRVIALGQAELEGAAAAIAWAQTALLEHPSLLGLETLLLLRERAATQSPDQAVQTSAIDGIVSQLVRPQARRLAKYRCLQCGFEGRRFHWHCPGCNQWGRCSPRRIEEISA
jgi:lipopolysaccharide biosynthesis regulator YciM